jgi:hypothetical protein
MPGELGIERSLKRAAKSTGQPLFEKYVVVKDRLFKQELGYWAAKFPGGNDHGPQHVQRVLEKFDWLIGGNPAKHSFLRPYELYLAMMSILYHDIGLLRGREGHADSSSLFVEAEHNDYLIDPRDRDIISAAVVSHSSSKDIATEASRFADEELIGDQSVRPRVIAALVRLADELDEDFRRADSTVQSKLDVPEASDFYWEFCQRIRGIRPDVKSRSINIDVKFEKEDVGRSVLVNGRRRPFLSAFADKLAKINGERKAVTPHLPDPLRYLQLKVSVKPIQGHKTWTHPRDFICSDYTSASEFVEAFPELLIEPAKKWLLETLEFIRVGNIDEASASLNRLQEIAEDLPNPIRLNIFYNAACLESIKTSLAPDDEQYEETLRLSLHNLSRWLRLGLDEVWEAEGLLPYNEVYKMARDGDLHYLLLKHREGVVDQLPKKLQAAVPKRPPEKIPIGGGGCLSRGTLVMTPKGKVPVENLREGDDILSINFEGPPTIICTKVFRVNTLRESKCVNINDRCLVTLSQPVYAFSGQPIPARALRPGMSLLAPSLNPEEIRQSRIIKDYFEVYSLTTNHRSHNFILEDFMVCHNKRIIFRDEI